MHMNNCSGTYFFSIWVSSKNKIEVFQDFVLDDARAVSEAINSGARSFSELIPIIQKATRFKKWIADKEPDAQLAKDYFREVTADTWVDK